MNRREITMRKTHELHTRRRSRNWAVGVLLFALIMLTFAVTIVKLGAHAGNPSTGQSWGQSLVIWLRGDEQ